MPQDVKEPPTLGPAIPSRMLGQKIVNMTRLPGGRNSRVYLLDAADGRKYVAKHYPPRDGERADGLSVEFRSLRFLWDHDERAIPEPVAIDQDHRLALYTWVDGHAADPSQTGQAEIDQAVDFLLRLKQLSKRPEALELPDAAEARFSVTGIIENIESRLERLKSLGQPTPNHQALAGFLSDTFEPALRKMVDGGRALAGGLGILFDSELAREERTLSPSDFGFHNAVLQSDGRIAFLDFEYFGWDDPAKMISDFLLHPAMDLAPENRDRFFSKVTSGITRGLGDQKALVDRIRVVAPLFALKWCLILLNEFIPKDAGRRAFASNAPVDQTTAQDIQLQKAMKMAGIAEGYYDQFPF